MNQGVPHCTLYFSFKVVVLFMLFNLCYFHFGIFSKSIFLGSAGRAEPFKFGFPFWALIGFHFGRFGLRFWIKIHAKTCVKINAEKVMKMVLKKTKN